ncbi:MAG: DUF4410 domain-containing protein [Verrucomicrobiae bacterium]|nr:DUF4410 domain-containing protein [Verrucomicrobiae bacterium]
MTSSLRSIVRATSWLTGAGVAVLILASGCRSANIKDEQQTGPAPTMSPTVVYVTNFGADLADVKTNKGILGRGGLLNRTTPEEERDKLVNLMASALVEQLNKNGVTARRVLADNELPATGWVIRGQFIEIDEGGRTRRALIGFGAGQSSMDLMVNVCDLKNNPNAPFLIFGSDVNSGKMPGAVVTMNPYVAAAKFVMSKKAPEKDTKAAAAKIAAEVAKYMTDKGLK